MRSLSHHRSLYSRHEFSRPSAYLRFCVIVSAAGSRGDVCVSQIERAAVTEEVIQIVCRERQSKPRGIVKLRGCSTLLLLREFRRRSNDTGFT